MFIKICANTNLGDAQFAADLGANAIGFVFAPSKRHVTAAQVSTIVDKLPPAPDKIGVFATTDPTEIAAAVTAAHLTGVQLHGTFTAATINALHAKFGGDLKLIQTVAYPIDSLDRAAADRHFSETLREAFSEPALWAILVDAAKSGTSGGLGVAFDWAHVAAIVHHTAATLDKRPRIILAGGLTPDNVASAIATFKPWGIDVASGVEASPGRKDPDRLQAFLRNARAAFLQQNDKLAG
jgi:phosphoribosylanthranilate isomerase